MGGSSRGWLRRQASVERDRLHVRSCYQHSRQARILRHTRTSPVGDPRRQESCGVHPKAGLDPLKREGCRARNRIGGQRSRPRRDDIRLGPSVTASPYLVCAIRNSQTAESPYIGTVSSSHDRTTEVREECAMNIVVLLIILLLLFGGGGFYLGGPAIGGSLGGLILLVLIVMLLTGRLGSRA